MLNITGEHISELNDSDLRTLIGLLCEAELRANNISTAGVTWGGHQNAPDGGIDVRVEFPESIHEGGFVPKPITGFQVKKPDMPKSAILEEMCPAGKLRPIIKEIIDANGAYIIVSSQGSTADSALRDRKKAMSDAVSNNNSESDFKVDFYDRNRVASWVRNHPAVILWTKEKIGRSTLGWKAYGNWSNSPEGVDNEFIFDEELRLKENEDAYTIKEGLTKMRKLLSQPGSSIRLVGLSGVGKTRLLQALFDKRLGEEALNTLEVCYTDISDSPLPDPRHFAEELVAMKVQSILVVDNCPPELHRRLTSICSKEDSLVSLITVEYDVKEDQPEETNVFRLEPASGDIIEKIILKRFSHINEINARRISELAGGNARIAIVLANTVKTQENITDLNDDDLFNRLFEQRNVPNSSLIRTAEACALVYSFNLEDKLDKNSEIKLLSTLANMSSRELFLNIIELQRRELVQHRGIWRAVLPHAIANKLAVRSLENIPLEEVLKVFEELSSERLSKSFSRRLSYLPNSSIAIQISKKWLSKEGFIGDFVNLNSFKIRLLNDIAHISPEETLKSFEKVKENESHQHFFTRNNPHYGELTRILRLLAYDKELFFRSTKLLSLFALSEKPNENYNSIRNILKSLFYLYLSGTHATPEDRLAIIKELINSNIEKNIDLGIFLLEATLESRHFTSAYSFEFGSRNRDYGFVPSNTEEVNNWYALFINYTVSLINNDTLISKKAYFLLVKKFRGLWTKAGMYKEIEKAIEKMEEYNFSIEIWLEIKSTLRFDGNEMKEEIYNTLKRLEHRLEPVTLSDRITLYGLGERYEIHLIYSEESDVETSAALEEIRLKTISLGKELVNDQEVFKAILPNLMSKEAGGGSYHIGRGIAEGSTDPLCTWQEMCKLLDEVLESERDHKLISGFLTSLAWGDNNIYQKLLDEAVTDNRYALIFPRLQITENMNFRDIERLKKSIEYGRAEIWEYSKLGYIKPMINESDLIEILRSIASKESGGLVAIEILSNIFRNTEKEEEVSDELKLIGQDLIIAHDFEGISRLNQEYVLSRLIKLCFLGDYAKQNAAILSAKFLDLVVNKHGYRGINKLISSLAQVQPNVFLDTFLLQKDSRDIDYSMSLFKGDLFSSNPMSEIPDDILIKWCEVAPKLRYTKVAAFVTPFKKSEREKMSVEWTSLAQKLIRNSPDSLEVLKGFESSFRPSSWSGSRADIMRKYLYLIIDTEHHDDTVVREWARNEKIKLEEEILSWRKGEREREINRNERFE